MAGFVGVAAALLAAWLAALPACELTEDFLLPHDQELPLDLEPELKLGFEAEGFEPDPKLVFGADDLEPPNHELPLDDLEPEPKLDFEPELKLERPPLLNEDREPELNDRPPPPDPPLA